MWDNNEMGDAEQNVFDNVINTSYCNINKINLIYGKLFGITILDTNDIMKKHFEKRHIIAHKNGRNKDGEMEILNKLDIDGLISDANEFVKQIMDKLAGIETEIK